MSIQVDELLGEISAESPCGEDIGYDPAYLELERLVQGTPETQFSQSEDPNWPDVVNRCLDLNQRSRHLRVAVFLTLGLLGKEGVSGLRDGLAFIRGLLDRYWESVHPQLDPDDNLDPTERLNILASLSPSADTFEDSFKFVNRFMQAPLCQSRQVGRFGLKDILQAAGELPVPPETAAPQLAVIHAAFDDAKVEDVQATHQALVDAIVNLKGIEDVVGARVPTGGGLKLDRLCRVLEQADRHVQEALARRGYGTAPAAGSAGGAAAPDPARAPGVAVVQAAGTIGSKQDVVRMLDRICEFYEKHEPSSPVPLLLRRARRLVGKTFVDIIRDMTPDAMTQVELISGASNDPGAAAPGGAPE